MFTARARTEGHARACRGGVTIHERAAGVERSLVCLLAETTERMSVLLTRVARAASEHIIISNNNSHYDHGPRIERGIVLERLG